jgi:hypothetical protein
VIVVAERGGAAIVLKLEGFGVDLPQLRRLAVRVLDSL